MALKIEFFPTVGCCGDWGGWAVGVHGWVYRRAEVSRLRRAGLGLARRVLKMRYGDVRGAVELFGERFGAFLADNERGERVRIRVEGQEFLLKKSRSDGHFREEIFLRGAKEGWVEFGGRVECEDEGKEFLGRAMLLGREGVSVVSDIDDTIKVTEVRRRREMLRVSTGLWRVFEAAEEIGEFRISE